MTLYVAPALGVDELAAVLAVLVVATGAIWCLSRRRAQPAPLRVPEFVPCVLCQDRERLLLAFGRAERDAATRATDNAVLRASLGVTTRALGKERDEAREALALVTAERDAFRKRWGGPVSGQQRVVAAILGRLVAGDTPEDLAKDYGMDPEDFASVSKWLAEAESRLSEVTRERDVNMEAYRSAAQRAEDEATGAEQTERARDEALRLLGEWVSLYGDKPMRVAEGPVRMQLATVTRRFLASLPATPPAPPADGEEKKSLQNIPKIFQSGGPPAEAPSRRAAEVARLMSDAWPQPDEAPRFRPQSNDEACAGCGETWNYHGLESGHCPPKAEPLAAAADRAQGKPATTVMCQCRELVVDVDGPKSKILLDDVWHAAEKCEEGGATPAAADVRAYLSQLWQINASDEVLLAALSDARARGVNPFDGSPSEERAK